MDRIEYIKMNELEDSHFWFLAKRLYVKSVLSTVKTKINKILDIGSGTGGMTKYLNNFGKVTGLEQSRLAIKFAAKRGLNIVSGSANNLPFKQGSFNLITLFDVLYHKKIKSEKIVLLQIHKLLKNKGFLLITDSAFDFLQGGHDKATHGRKRYSLQELKKIVSSSGFNIIKSTYIFTSIFPIAVVKRIVIDKINNSNSSDVTKLPNFINQVLLNILRIESYIIKYINLPFGLSILILAQKK